MAILAVSTEAYREIYKALKAAGYEQQFYEHEGYPVIDMQGIGLRVERDVSKRTVTRKRVRKVP